MCNHRQRYFSIKDYSYSGNFFVSSSTLLATSSFLFAKSNTQSAMQSAITFISSGTHAAGREAGGADAHAARHKRAALLAGDGVLVRGDVHLVQIVLQLLAGAVLVGQVDQQQVVVRAAGDQLHAAGGQLGLKRLRVLNDFAGILLELRLQRLAKADGLRGDDVLQRAACVPGKMAELMRLMIYSLFVKIRPPRGPRSVLWVVVVTTSA